ncbi:MAG: endolytic transglycosylase MltG, partial [Caldimicrobium sp.]
NYILGTSKRSLSFKETRTPSPYNTYLHNKLPPTPIGNPSKKSMLAVLKPAKVPYLYFVATGDGRHIFSKTYKEHLAAIQKIRSTPNQEEAINPQKILYHDNSTIQERDLLSL